MNRTVILILSVLAFLVGSSAALAESKAERTLRLKNDREVLRALAEAGSNLTKPHRIEFHFVSYNESKTTALAEDGKKMGYRISSVDSLVDANAKQYWFFDLIQDVVPSEKNVFSHTEIMAKLSKKYGAEFDGWGCHIVK